MLKRILFLTITITIILSSFCFAVTEAKLVKTLNTGLTTIKSWIIKLSTPAAAVAIGTGVFMKKFSFGDEQRIIMGKKLIKSTLFSYAFILGVDLVLSAISLLVTGKQ